MQREGVIREMRRCKADEEVNERRTRQKAEAVRRVPKTARKQAQRDCLIAPPKRREDARRSIAWFNSFQDFCSDSTGRLQPTYSSLPDCIFRDRGNGL